MKTKSSFLKRPGFLASLLLAATLLLSGLTTSTVEASHYPTGSWNQIHSGIWYAEGSTNSPRLMRAFALKVDTWNPWVSFKATPGNGGATGQTTRRTTPYFRNQFGLGAAINANFYQVVGSGANIEGLLITDGNLVSGGASFNNTRRAQIRIDFNNMASLVDSTATPGGLHTAIAAAGFTLMGGVPAGDDVGTDPRTAIGITADGRHLIMVVIDGRQPGWSNGATMRDTGRWLHSFGAWNGGALDGGGSSTIVTSGGGVKNKPSDGSPRAVGANFGFKSKSASTQVRAAENTAMTVDNEGRIWYAQVKDDAKVHTRRYNPSSNSWDSITAHTNSGFDFGVSQFAAPAMVVFPGGNLRLWAVSASGQMFSRLHTNSTGSWGSWEAWGTDWSPDSGPVAVRRAEGDVSVIALKRNGTLRHRSWWQSSGWDSSWTTHGVEDSWSPYARPGLGVNSDGKMWLAAIKKDGTLFTRYWHAFTSWVDWTSHGGNWSPVGGVGVNGDRPDGKMSFAAVKSNGALMHRTWTGTAFNSWTEHGTANWSTYHVPTMIDATDKDANERLWIFATKANGTLYHRSFTSAGGWGSFISNGSGWSTNVGPAAIPIASGGFMWTAVENDSTLYTRRLHLGSGWADKVGHGNGWVK